MLNTRTFYVLIDRNSKGVLIYSLLPGPSATLEREADTGLFPAWNFGYSPTAEAVWRIHVYARALGHQPTDTEEIAIQKRILVLIQESSGNTE